MPATPSPASNARAAGRPLRWERRPEARPAELLDAALAVFAERGYRNARLDEVAEAAGVTKGTLYHYFATKEELLVQVLERHQALLFDRVAELLREPAGPASARLRLVVRRGFAAQDEARARLVRLVVQAAAHEVPAVFHRWLADGPVRAWQVVADLVREGQAMGEFRPDADADVAARVLLSGLMLQAVWRPHAEHVPGLALDPDRLLDSALDLFLHGLRPAYPLAPAADSAGR